jgi:hypothetical protein
LVRVDAGASLWHAVLDVDGRPERVQVRLGSGPDAVDATFTFFDNEVLVWRRGAHPSAEAIPLSAPVSLDWAPVSCRDAFAVSGSASGSEAKSAPSTERARFAIRTVDLAEGGVVGTVGPQA